MPIPHKLFGIGAVILIAAGCGGDSPPPEPARPDHPDGGTPPFDDDDGGSGGSPPEGSAAGRAAKLLGSYFDLFVRAIKGGRAGCGTIRVEDLRFSNANDDHHALFAGLARWSSAPPSFLKGDGQVASDVAYRSGDVPISWFTEDYAKYGTLGLKYAVTGSLDIETNLFRLTLKNIDAESGEESNQFVAAVYDPWTDSSGQAVTCVANEAFENEFLVASPAAEVEVTLADSGGLGTLCGPCTPPVDQIQFEMR